MGFCFPRLPRAYRTPSSISRNGRYRNYAFVITYVYLFIPDSRPSDISLDDSRFFREANRAGRGRHCLCGHAAERARKISAGCVYVSSLSSSPTKNHDAHDAHDALAHIVLLCARARRCLVSEVRHGATCVMVDKANRAAGLGCCSDGLSSLGRPSNRAGVALPLSYAGRPYLTLPCRCRARPWQFH